MKYILGIGLIFFIQSCDIYDSYVQNEYIDFPIGLDKKQLQQEITARNIKLEKNSDSLVPFSSLGKKKLLVRELYYFKNTHIPLKELKSVDSLVDLLCEIRKRKLMWSNMDYKIHGVKGEKLWFTKKSTRIETNAKVDDIMNQLRNKLKFKYDNRMFYSYTYYLIVSRKQDLISKRLIKIKNLKDRYIPKVH